MENGEGHTYTPHFLLQLKSAIGWFQSIIGTNDDLLELNQLKSTAQLIIDRSPALTTYSSPNS